MIIGDQLLPLLVAVIFVGFFDDSKAASGSGSNRRCPFKFSTGQDTTSKSRFPQFACVFQGSRKCTAPTARLDGKVAIVTGSNTGIGKVTALEFCKRGARVIMACRNSEKCASAAEEMRRGMANVRNPGVLVPKQLDLASFNSVRRFAREILETEPQINLLINNAGVMMCPRELTEDGHERQFATNHLGHFLLTMVLLPRMIRSRNARIVNVSSAAYMWGDGSMHLDDVTLRQSYTPAGAYGRSKLANILFTNELAKRLEANHVEGVTTYSLHPGVIDTELYRHLGSSKSSIIRRLWKSHLLSAFQKSPIQGAQTTLYCSLDERAGRENGLYYSDCKPKPLTRRARDKKSAQDLWDYSWRAVGLPDGYSPFVEG